MKKLCTDCNQLKSEKLFYRKAGGKLGLRAECIECGKKRNEAYSKRKSKKALENKKIYNKKYYQENKERLRDSRIEYMKEYQQTLNGKYSEYKAGAKKRGIKFSLSLNEFSTLWRKNCKYCDSAIDTIGLDRINNNIGYKYENVIACCSICNRMKGDMSLREFKEHILKIQSFALKTS
jgi:hypothetical protein